MARRRKARKSPPSQGRNRKNPSWISEWGPPALAAAVGALVRYILDRFGVTS
jgi:hypothetical protein